MISWREIYRRFADDYQWLPRQINELTLYQLRMYSTDTKDLGSTKKITPHEAKRYAASRKEQIESFVADVTQRALNACRRANLG